MKRINIEYETQPIINKSKNLEKITHELFVDWSELPKNQPVTPIKINMNKTKKDNENVA